MNAPDYAARRELLRDRLRQAALPALLVTHLPNVRYLTGLAASNATLLWFSDGSPGVLVTDGRYAERAAACADGLELVVTRADDWLQQRLGGCGVLGVESHALAWDRVRELDDRLDAVDLVPAPGHVEELRACKDDAELGALRRACAITVDALAALPGWLAPGRTERDIVRRLRDEMLDRGADDTSHLMVASGPHSARPHHAPTDRPLAHGDLLSLDVGAVVDGYHADMTRSFALGDPGEDLRRVHDVVRRAHRAGLDAVIDGIAAGQVDAACRDHIAAEGHGERFLHSTGHGVGLELHERPILRSGETATLRSRMAVTVEPGVYVPGRGGVRIEDVVVVTERGRENLTSAPTDLVIL